ncbi:3-ketoacyl-CoA synthase [Monocercomonoides exilis]|uniref:3-ketoacyl-CoA synthase n=1 Tax=Monocercomonoides exilis TaxID=2049356 RepID=UPI00355A9B0D|nr:3-ketoacyl-CoA synthase [Monocercomonoides exilis]
MLRFNVFAYFTPSHLKTLWQKAGFSRLSVSIIFILFAIVFSMMILMRSKRPVYLLDYVCWQPPEQVAISHDEYLKRAQESGCYTQASLDFQRFLLTHNGLSNSTYLPPQVFNPQMTLNDCLTEVLTCVFGILDKLFAENPFFDAQSQLDILIIACPSFSTQPSVCEYVCNRYKLKTSIKSYSLSGMGTASGLLAIDLAQDLLQTKSQLHAVVITTDCCNANWYRGNDKDLLVANTLWRWGGAGVLLSNSSKDQRYGRYKLLKCIRTNMAQNDDCFRSIEVKEDDEGKAGMHLSKTLRRPMGIGLKMNINMLCPYIMSMDDLFRVSLNRWLKKHFNTQLPFKLDFTKYINHFCVHAGGIKLINDIRRNLSLSDDTIEAAYATLSRYGLLSGPSPWYQLAFLERKKRIRRGDTIWQLSYGSGFISVSATWIALRGSDLDATGDSWPELIVDPSHQYTLGTGGDEQEVEEQERGAEEQREESEREEEEERMDEEGEESERNDVMRKKTDSDEQGIRSGRSNGVLDEEDDEQNQENSITQEDERFLEETKQIMQRKVQIVRLVPHDPE